MSTANSIAASIVRKVIFGLFVGIFIGMLGFRISEQLTDADTETPNDTKTSTELAQVTLVSLDDVSKDIVTIHRTGSIESVNQLALISPISSKVVRVNTTAGMAVKKGDVLVEFDRTELERQLREANISLAGMSNLESVTTSTLKTQSDIEKVRALLEQARGQYDRAQKDLATIQTQSDNAIAAQETQVTTARNELLRTEVTVQTNEQNIYKDILVQVQTSIANAQTALMFVAEIEQTSFANVQRVEVQEVAQKKADALSALFGITGAQTYSRETIQELAGGLKQVYSEENAKSVHTYEDMQALLQGTLDAAQKTALALDAVKKGVVAVNGSADLIQKVEQQSTVVTNNVTELVNKNQSLNSAKTSNSVSLQSAQQALRDAEASLSQTKVQARSSIEIAQSLLKIQETFIARAEDTYAVINNDELQTFVADAQKEKTHAQALRDKIQKNYDRAIIVAPADGVVANVHVTANSNVTMGNPVITLSNTKGVQVVTHIAHSERDDLEVGDAALINNMYDAVVVSIDTDINPVTKKLKVVLAMQEGFDYFSAGEFVYVDIFGNSDIAADADTHAVFITALKTKKTGDYVFSVTDHLVTQYEVSIQELMSDRAFIRFISSTPTKIISDVRGIEVGDKVIEKK